MLMTNARVGVRGWERKLAEVGRNIHLSDLEPSSSRGTVLSWHVESTGSAIAFQLRQADSSTDLHSSGCLLLTVRAAGVLTAYRALWKLRRAAYNVFFMRHRSSRNGVRNIGR